MTYAKVSEHDVFMDCAISYARLSKCASMSVGCVAVNENGKIISTGVNGTVSGHVNCCDVFHGSSPEHSAWSLDHEIHAEMNMILELARSSQKFRELNVYTTHSPCWNCLKHLCGLQNHKSGVYLKKIVFNEAYYKLTEEDVLKQKQYAEQFGVKLSHIKEVQ